MRAQLCSARFMMAPLAAILLLVTSCGNRPAPTVVPSANMKTEDLERSRLGLRQIHADWFQYRTEFGAEDWKLRSSDRWLAKKIQRDTATGKPLWEEDYYYTGRTFATPEGQQWEEITVHYEYGSRKLLVSYVGQDTATTSAVERANSLPTLNEKLSAVERALEKWGIPRL
jgi:hypothetical protein